MRSTIFIIFLAIFSIFIANIDGIVIQRSPGSNRINARLQVPFPSDGITFMALLPNADCLTEQLEDNRLFIDFPGCRISLDWSNSLFGTTRYFRHDAARPMLRRVRRKWRVGPVQKLKFGSAIIHYGNNMRVHLNDSGMMVESVAPNGMQMGPKQTKAFNCPLGLANNGGILQMDIFTTAGTSKCQIGLEFDSDYKLLGSEEKSANAGDPKEMALEQEAMQD